MEDKNKWILIGLQLFHVALFLIIAFCFLAFALNKDNLQECYFPCVGNQNPDITTPCKQGVSEDICTCDEPMDYNVTLRFKTVFYTGFITYLLDAICRFIIVGGLYAGRIYWQFAGVFGTVVVSTFFQTTMLIIMPIYRYNTAGLACA